MNDKKDYESYPNGFNALSEDMFILGVKDEEAKKAALWNLVEQLIGA